MERAILISPKDLYQLLSLMKENQTKLIMGPKDPLVKILQQFSSFEVQVSNKPTLLKVESRDERPPPSELESIKQEIIQLFCSLEVEEIIPDSPSFYTVIKNLKVVCFLF